MRRKVLCRRCRVLVNNKCPKHGYDHCVDLHWTARIPRKDAGEKEWAAFEKLFVHRRRPEHRPELTRFDKQGYKYNWLTGEYIHRRPGRWRYL